MRLTILSFIFIVFCHISIAQVPVNNNNLQSNNNCPLMEVSINSNNGNGIIEVFYCNHGNTTAIGAYVEIEVSNDLLITQATIPASSVVDNKYTFHLGDVNSLDCAAFYIEVPNVENKIHCTSVHIFPNNPCQAMIDRYVINSAGDDGDDGDDVDITAVTFSADMDYSTPGLPMGQGGPNSVFEDHVFLDNIPTWDSLLQVLTNSGVLPKIVDPNGLGTVNTVNGLNDITALASSELCSNKGNRGGTVVIGDYLSQTTNSAIGDRTILGTETNNNQVSSDARTSVKTNNLEENKEVTVRLYPNPFSSRATITIDGANYQQATLEILDLAGKSIQSIPINEQQSITLHRENLSQGIYFYRLIGDNITVHTGKFVVR